MSDRPKAEPSTASSAAGGDRIAPPVVSTVDGGAGSAVVGHTGRDGGAELPADPSTSDAGGSSSAGEPKPAGARSPAVPRRRRRRRVNYDLLDCALHGHALVGTDAATVRAEDAQFVRELDGKRWYRCLRCDDWIVRDRPADPQREYPPAPGEVTVPLRGRRLRDRYVLRLIVIDRVLHAAVLGLLTVAIFLFAQHRIFLHHDYTKVLAALQGGVGGPVGSSHSGIVRDLNRLFALSTSKLYLVGVVVAAYTAMLVAEAVGLWRARRWAEYLTLVETGLLVPFEIYELTSSVTVLKVLTLIINLAIVLYLLIAHRLFGIRGGKAAALAEYGADG